MIGLLPAIVDSIDREARIARVRIPGLTDGAAELPEAEFCNPIGDKSEHTEIRVLPGDRVWLAFAGGDTRYPVIVGYRPRQEENGIDWRRFEHANFQFQADSEFIIDAGLKVTINGAKEVIVNTEKALVNASKTAEVNAGEQVTVVTPVVLIDSPDSTFKGAVKVEGPLSYMAGMTGKGGAKITGSATIEGGAAIKGGSTVEGGSTITGGLSVDGSLTNNGKNTGSDHRHGNTKPGSSGEQSGTPI